jgi:tRNA-2-methylthio-N6-dimethylallyladenosine synthase
MKPQRLFIHTIGCQMNVYDSERIIRVLAVCGYRPTEVLEEADLVITNTCAIRAKAEQKAFSFVGRLARMKRRNPNLLIGVGGCVAQQEGDAILTRMPHVDLVFGTHAIARLPELVAQIKNHHSPMVDVQRADGIEEIAFTKGGAGIEGPISRFVTIMQGCDNYCTYCVVPYVRGPEMSRSPDRIVAEIEALVGEGVREVTLLGQNVNSYGRKEGLPPFAVLLERINRIAGLARIRFTTSHPKDLSDDLMAAFGKLDKLCPHIHLPVQSGSDRILKRMNRNYTRRLYLERIERLRRVRPDMAVTSDFIVGFPGESRRDFEQTLALVEEVGFDGLFAFMYSDRDTAPASHFKDKVREDEKKDRLQELLTTQEAITLAKNQALVRSVQPILVEGRSSRPGLAEAHDEGPQWTGRTPGNKIVNFSWLPDALTGDVPQIGRLVDVEIKKAFSHSLYGGLAGGSASRGCLEGNKCHAA